MSSRVEVGDPVHFSLTEAMAGHHELWNRMAQEYGLKHSYDEVSAWPFGDHVFGYDYDFFDRLVKDPPGRFP